MYRTKATPSRRLFPLRFVVHKTRAKYFYGIVREKCRECDFDSFIKKRERESLLTRWESLYPCYLVNGPRLRAHYVGNESRQRCP